MHIILWLFFVKLFAHKTKLIIVDLLINDKITRRIRRGALIIKNLSGGCAGKISTHRYGQSAYFIVMYFSGTWTLVMPM